MADNLNNSNPYTNLKQSYIEDPRILSELVLTDGVSNGMITFPDFTNDENKGNPITVPFVMSGDFGFSLGNKWDTIIPEGIGDFLSNMANYGSMISENSADTQVQLVSRAMSMAVWKGSDIPKFSVNLVFVATRRSLNPVEIIEALAATCLPLPLKDSEGNVQKIKDASAEGVTKASEGLAGFLNNIGQTYGDSVKQLGSTIATAIRSSGLEAPIRYKARPNFTNDTADASENCTLSLYIGRWFAAHKLIMESISNITFSKETIAPQSAWLYEAGENTIYHKNLTKKEEQGQWGFPLYATCTVTLRPITYITYPEFCQFFRVPQRTSKTTTENNT